MSDPEGADSAKDLFREMAGSDDERAAKLVKAVVSAGSKQALDTIIGSGPIPSNLTNARAEYLHVVTVLFGLTLTVDEVEVIFRCTKASAKLVISTMNATYASSIHDLRLEEMRAGAKPTQGGDIESGLTWRVCFESEAAFETAVNEIDKMRRRSDVRVDKEDLCVEFIQEADDDDAGLLKSLNIPVPSKSDARTKRRSG